MTYAVFSFVNGKWHLVEKFASLTEARQECAYLCDCLGLNAKVFCR